MPDPAIPDPAIPDPAHNLDLGPEAGAAHALALLRAADLTLPVGPEVPAHLPLVPGIFLARDPEAAVTGMLRSAPGQILRIALVPERPGRWLALHVAFGEAGFAGQIALGLACRLAAPAATTLRACLRSGVEGGPGGAFVDRFFRKTLVAHADASLHLDLMALEAAPDLPLAPTWRELILFLRPEESQTIDLQDLRVFAA